MPCRPGTLGLALAISLMLTGMDAFSQATVTTLTFAGSSQPGFINSGSKDGNTYSTAKFHFQAGIALDPSGTRLFIADCTNNAIRMVNSLGDKSASLTFTAYNSANGISHPLAVAVDTATNIYVLNHGNGKNGSLLVCNGSYYLDYNLKTVIATNATHLTNAVGLALDTANNAYITVNSNTVIRVTPAGVTTVVGVITNAHTSLRGIACLSSGKLAIADAGNNGIWQMDPGNTNLFNNAVQFTGFHGAGDVIGPAAYAAFNHPEDLARAGSDVLVVADRLNNKVKVVDANGTVTRLYGVSSTYWSKVPSLLTPGWDDGTVNPVESSDTVQAREPYGLAVAADGTLYVTEVHYDILREATGTGLPVLPPPPAQVPAPQIGWVDFPPPSFTSVFHAGTTNYASFVFNNDTPPYMVIMGTAGSQTFYTYGATPTNGVIPDPNSGSASAPVGYMDGLYSVNGLTVASTMPDLTIKAISEKNDGSPNSPVVQARFQFITGNPLIVGNNAAQFTISDITANAHLYYTLDGSDPSSTNGVDLGVSASTNGWLVGFPISTNTLFKVRAFRNNYQPSAIVTNQFLPGNYAANTISFGFASGEASSDFVGAPGQTFYAPVTLTTLPGTVIYSLQFNLTVTNASLTTNAGPAITPGAYGFQSMLKTPIPPPTNFPPGVNLYAPIPPFMFIADASSPPPPGSIVTYNGTNFINLETTNTSLNLLGVGWLERYTQTNLYNTLSQTLISYSMAHDDLFPNALQPNGVIAGGYSFKIPTTATNGQQYKIQIGRPSATDDGVGGPGSDVYIVAPTNGATAGGAPMSALKYVTVGQRKYVAGSVYPFRWFNAGDFGSSNIVNADVEQVFQSAIYSFNYPPAGSDFFDGMDSCGNIGVLDNNAADPNFGYYTNTFASLNAGQLNALFDGNDTTINQIAFGDGVLDVCDVYVTFRRSLDPSLTLFERFWNNGQLVADTNAPNVANHLAIKAGMSSVQSKLVSGGSTVSPQVNFTAGDITNCSAGQVVPIPINATIFGNYPLRVLMLNLTVEPLDGSPALTTPVQFTQNAAVLGTPTPLIPAAMAITPPSGSTAPSPA